MTDPLMSRDEVAALFRIDPNSVRDTLRRYGITEQRGYPRAEVEAIRRPGRGGKVRRPTGTEQTIETLPKEIASTARKLERMTRQLQRLLAEEDSARPEVSAPTTWTVLPVTLAEQPTNPDPTTEETK